MKKMTKSLTPKESVTFEPRLASSRSEPSLVKPSLHPWYYVKGRKDLTEKNISSRREREEQRHRQYVSNSQYFDKRMAETQVFHKWADNQSLVKHPKQLPILSLRPPYDTTEQKPIPGLDIRLNKEFQKKYSKAKQKLTQFMHKFKELDKNEIKLEKRQNIFVFQIKELRKIQNRVEEKKQFYDFSSKQLSQIRFNRNKLRKKAFHVIETLSYYKISVKKIQVLKDSEVLKEEEMIQLTEVIERALKILEMYIDLNHNRNNEFQIMFE